MKSYQNQQLKCSRNLKFPNPEACNLRSKDVCNKSTLCAKSKEKLSSFSWSKSHFQQNQCQTRVPRCNYCSAPITEQTLQFHLQHIMFSTVQSAWSRKPQTEQFSPRLGKRRIQRYFHSALNKNDRGGIKQFRSDSKSSGREQLSVTRRFSDHSHKGARPLPLSQSALQEKWRGV